MTVAAAAAAARVAELQGLARALDAGPAAVTGGISFADALGAQATTPVAAAAPVAAGAGAVQGVPYAAEITAAAQRHGVDPALLAALVQQESGFDPKAGSPAGAQGLTQLMPATARSLGVTDVHDPAQSLDGGAKYLREQLDRFGGDERLALAAYNAGPGAVERFGGVPPYAETQAYVEKVTAGRDRIRAQSAIAPVSGVAPSPLGVSSTSTVPGSSPALAYPII